MKSIVHIMGWILIMSIASFAAVLTDDLQVVIPTGRPLMEEVEICRHHHDLMQPEMIFKWDGGNTSIVFIRDQLDHNLETELKSMKAFEGIQQTLNLDGSTELRINGKTFRIHVNLE